MANVEIVAVLTQASAAARMREASTDMEFAAAGLELRPIFDPAGPIDEGPSPAPHRPSQLSLTRYMRVEADETAAAEIAAELRARPDIETAYVKPLPSLPIAPGLEQTLRMSGLAGPSVDTVAGRPPDLQRFQGYCEAPPTGIGVDAAAGLAGGDGTGVRIIDIEGGWCLTHTDLMGTGGLFGGDDFPEADWRDHGTAVFGIIMANSGLQGVTGIAPGTDVSAYTHRSFGAAGAIQRAADLLSPGDILLLEMHQPGPRHNYRYRPKDQLGYIAVEWWEECFVAIRYAIARGVIVVEAAGNGTEDLDDPIYDQPHADFSAEWRNPFGSGADSGAILVGAGAPASGRYGAPRSRLGFSNYGARLDCQGWGYEVATTGYGDLYRGSGENEWFTAEFGGTSSASPIVTGALACLQGIAMARGQPLTPMLARDLLRRIGSPQPSVPGEPTKRIGHLPNLSALIAAL